MPTSMLASQFRPKKFADVCGQKHVVIPIQNAIKNKSLSQALLFHGPSGTGKTTLARIIAKSLNCDKAIDGEPCCECNNCKRIDADNSNDLIEFDAASNGGVNEIREIQAMVAAASLATHKRVFIIDEAHMLTAQASNALLKTLEEPPKNVTFILATTELNKLLITIRTRCQKYALSSLTTDEVTHCLDTITKTLGIEVDPNAFTLICRGSKGGMREAIQFLEKIVSSQNKTKITTKDVADTFGAVSINLLMSFFNHIKTNNAVEIIIYIDKIINDGIPLPDFWAELQQFLRGLNFTKQVKILEQLTTILPYDDACLKKLSEISSLLNTQTLLSAWKQTIETQNLLDLPSVAGRMREVVEEASLRLTTLDWKQNIAKKPESPKQETLKHEMKGLPVFGGKFQTL